MITAVAALEGEVAGIRRQMKIARSFSVGEALFCASGYPLRDIQPGPEVNRTIFDPSQGLPRYCFPMFCRRLRLADRIELVTGFAQGPL